MLYLKICTVLKLNGTRDNRGKVGQMILQVWKKRMRVYEATYSRFFKSGSDILVISRSLCDRLEDLI